MTFAAEAWQQRQERLLAEADTYLRERERHDKDRTLGEAANRWVTWQIVMSFIGLAIFLFMLLFFFLPMWNNFLRPIGL